ncbi:MAG: hypothetical protein ABI999_08385 [Acidobacteriota bacterium]
MDRQKSPRRATRQMLSAVKESLRRIVGCRGKRVHPEATDEDAYKNWEFLVIDPWAGGASTGSTTILYAGIQTKFLGIAAQVGLKIVYDSIEIYSVEGPFAW